MARKLDNLVNIWSNFSYFGPNSFGTETDHVLAKLGFQEIKTTNKDDDTKDKIQETEENLYFEWIMEEEFQPLGTSVNP
jgi:hypothetical protein